MTIINKVSPLLLQDSRQDRPSDLSEHESRMSSSVFTTLTHCISMGFRLERPTLDTRMTEGDWQLFRDHWEEFKVRNNIAGAEAVKQLVAVARGVLARRQARRFSSEEELLLKLKERAVKVMDDVDPGYKYSFLGETDIHDSRDLS